MIKRLSKCIREYKKDSILTPVFVIGEVVMEVVMPLLMAKLIDNGINAGNMDFVLKMGASSGTDTMIGALVAAKYSF